MEEFKENIIPGNYFLTKSMEFTKINTSGTLWYLKKYLVLYYNIFLSDGISTKEGIQAIINTFESFINSLPEESKKDATDYFFPKEVDIRNNYNTFVHFKGNKMFSDKKEENEYINLVKQFYFVYLMKVGGQSGVKKYIKKEYLYKPDFNMEKINEIIQEAIDKEPNSKHTITEIKNDYHATLRNERQILWYYGFVHSKSTGSSDSEFSSLTPVGEAAIKASYDEFRLIWEHQKIKMISQPVTVEFLDIENNIYANYEKFHINYSPYNTILNYLYKREKISKEEYQFIISRTNNFNKEYVQNNIDKLIENIEEIKKQVSLFDRSGDKNAEDFDKELKKYIIGIRQDIKKDYNKNEFGVCKYQKGIILTNKEAMQKMLLVYNQIEKYKLKKYTPLFEQCEKELKIKYNMQSKSEQYKVNPKVKIDWDLYNIHFDKIIILSLILTDYALKNNIKIQNLNIHTEEIKKIKNTYRNLLNSCNLGKTKELNSMIKLINIAITNEDLENVNLEEETYEYTYINEYTNLNVEDLKEKIKRISEENIKNTNTRIRDTRLINLMKALYNSIYSDKNKLIKCECCNETTFITIKDEAYLEYHHLLPFNIVDGQDHYINIYGICPNCHRKLHYGNEKLKAELYKKLDKNNNLNKTIFERFKFLYNKKALKSYQLEYALAEQIIDEKQYNEILA